MESIRSRIDEPGVLNHIDALGDLTNRFLISLDQNDASMLGEYMDQAHKHLQALRVSHPVLDKMVELARINGASGAKLTGGGLGGCVIALVSTSTKLHHLIDVFTKLGYPNHWVIDLERDYR
ncbi:MAG: hypothetical protein MZU97_19670 [Bacillus subtilis]|nr:hypothetical protein [Bacillus subtilis]